MDIHASCKNWKSKGECEKNRDYMVCVSYTRHAISVGFRRRIVHKFVVSVASVKLVIETVIMKTEDAQVFLK